MIIQLFALTLADHNKLPKVEDGGACGLCCCLALDDYLGNLPPSHDRSNLRQYYFRKLLHGYNLSSYYSKLTNCSTMIVARSTLPGSNTWDHSNSLDNCGPLELDPADFTDEILHTLRLALHNDDNCQLTADKKLRILQLIMQCGVRDLKRLSIMRSDCASAFDSQPITSPTAMLTLVDDIERSLDSFYMPTLVHRFLLIKLYLSFEAQVSLETATMRRTRNIRRRQQKPGEKLDPLPNRGVSAKNRVLDLMFKDQSDNVTLRSSRRRTEMFVTSGSNLHFLVSNLSLGLLLALPSHTVYPISFRLQTLNAKQNCQPIECSE